MDPTRLIQFYKKKKEKTTVDWLNLKRKVIRKTCVKNIFFSKKDKQCIPVHNPLNTKEQNKVKKDIKNPSWLTRVGMTNL
jgi:hypothetical protein